MKNNRGFTLLEGLLILVIVGILGFTGWYVYDIHNKTTDTFTNADAANSSVAKYSKKQNSTSTQQSSNTQSISKSNAPTCLTVDAAVAQGKITGTASYPSSGLPADEIIYAEKVSDSTKVYCDKIGERQSSGNNVLDFSIKAPIGDYYVYAMAAKELPNYRAYWDEYAKCGNQASCPSDGRKQYIKITVINGGTVSGGNAQDWYASN